MKHVKQRCTTSVRQHAFSQKVVNRWNSLDQSTIDYSDTMNQLKSSLSKWRTSKKGLFMDLVPLGLQAKPATGELPGELSVE